MSNLARFQISKINEQIKEAQGAEEATADEAAVKGDA